VGLPPPLIHRRWHLLWRTPNAGQRHCGKGSDGPSRRLGRGVAVIGPRPPSWPLDVDDNRRAQLAAARERGV
jgi:hypothetical protein